MRSALGASGKIPIYLQLHYAGAHRVPIDVLRAHAALVEVGRLAVVHRCTPEEGARILLEQALERPSFAQLDQAAKRPLAEACAAGFLASLREEVSAHAALRRQYPEPWGRA